MQPAVARVTLDPRLLLGTVPRVPSIHHTVGHSQKVETERNYCIDQLKVPQHLQAVVACFFPTRPSPPPLILLQLPTDKKRMFSSFFPAERFDLSTSIPARVIDPPLDTPVARLIILIRTKKKRVGL